MAGQVNTESGKIRGWRVFDGSKALSPVYTVLDAAHEFMKIAVKTWPDKALEVRSVYCRTKRK